jgi:hypothetical protein
MVDMAEEQTANPVPVMEPAPIEQTEEGAAEREREYAQRRQEYKEKQQRREEERKQQAQREHEAHEAHITVLPSCTKRDLPQ